MRITHALPLCLFAAIVSGISPTLAYAQFPGIIEDLGRELGIPLPSRDDRSRDSQDNRPRQFSPPNESGRGSGGGDFRVNPGWGRPRSQPQPQPRTPQTSPRYSSPPRYSYPSQPSAPAAKITLTCPSDQNGTVAYTLISGNREYRYTLKTGYRQTINARSTWYIRYESGSGSKIYRLRDNTDYVFLRDAQGQWQIYKKPEPVVSEPPELPQQPL